jgi:hypothetical protein
MKISTKIKTLAAGGASVIAAGLNSGVANAAVGRCPDGTELTNGQSLKDCPDLQGNTQNTNDLMATINTIINVIIGVIGFVAVVVIILGGVQYTTSAGDPGKVKKAKDTILYGIIGLVVALLAFAIVNFVLSSILKS